MTTVTQPSTSVNITAVWSTRHGCETCGTLHDRYHASVSDANGREIQLEIDPAVYVKLAACATDDDLRDGDYIGFAQPLIFPEVLS